MVYMITYDVHEHHEKINTFIRSNWDYSCNPCETTWFIAEDNLRERGILTVLKDWAAEEEVDLPYNMTIVRISGNPLVRTEDADERKCWLSIKPFLGSNYSST